MAERYDLVVIGAGPGGYVAAIRAGQLGLKVACIEKEAVGGTCLNVGCIPSKTLLHWTEMYDHIKRHGADFGFDGSGIAVDWQKLQQAKNKVIADFQQGIKGLFRKNRVTLIEGKASFVSNHMIQVHGEKGQQTVEAENFIVATGSYPIALPFLPFDEEKVVSSTGALSLSKIPKSMVVIGGGVIGLELASVYRRLGTQVTVVEMLDKIAVGIDEGIGALFKMELERQGLEFHLGAKVSKGEVGADGVTLTVESAGETLSLKGEVCLVSVGRRPNTAHLNLEDAGFGAGDHGLIGINGKFQTGSPNIYAIGDVVEGPMLAHRAEEEGIAVAEMLAGKKSQVDYSTIPNVIYTGPEVAGVGLTEQEAKKIGLETMIGTFPFAANSRARCVAANGMVKVIGHQPTGRLIGLHIMSPGAGEMIHEGVIAIKKKALVSDIAHACHAHPTLSEAIKEAAMAAIDKPIHM